MSIKTLSDLKFAQIFFENTLALKQEVYVSKDAILPAEPETDNLNDPEWVEFDRLEDELNKKLGLYAINDDFEAAKTRMVECLERHIEAVSSVKYEELKPVFSAALGRARTSHYDGARVVGIKFAARDRIVAMARRVAT